MIYLLTEADGVTPVSLWSAKWQLAVFLREHQAHGYRVFGARNGQRLQELAVRKIMEWQG